jgi:hypothetical protein
MRGIRRSSPKDAVGAFGQNVAGGANGRKARREAVCGNLDSWWNGRAGDDAPALIVGLDGVGKIWAAMDWLVDRGEAQPIVIVIPSSSVAGASFGSALSIKRFVADRLGAKGQVGLARSLPKPPSRTKDRLTGKQRAQACALKSMVAAASMMPLQQRREMPAWVTAGASLDW